MDWLPGDLDVPWSTHVFWDVTLPIAAFLSFVLLSFIVHFILNRVGRNFTRRHGLRIGEDIIQAIHGPVSRFFLVQGLLAVVIVLSRGDQLEETVGLTVSLDIAFRVWAVLSLLLVAVALVRMMSVLLTWYGEQYGSREDAILSPNLVPPLRRIATVAIYILAGLLALEILGVSVTPLVAGLGIGGLAVALAVQPTLSNFFAGSYLAGDRVVRTGDFIRLENGLEGYVRDIGWRSTRLLTPYNNVVVMPNSRLADSMLTNYSTPDLTIGVLVMCGVSYDCDLAEVERLAIQAGQQVLDEQDGADKSMAPWFGFETFGESNIDFWVWVQARSRLDSFLIKSELIKALHKQFGDAGIAINYPMRHLVFPEGGVPLDRGGPPSPAPHGDGA